MQRHSEIPSDVVAEIRLNQEDRYSYSNWLSPLVSQLERLRSGLGSSERLIANLLLCEPRLNAYVDVLVREGENGKLQPNVLAISRLIAALIEGLPAEVYTSA
jgi:hypothetical protein